jgi:hypothetical protein
VQWFYEPAPAASGFTTTWIIIIIITWDQSACHNAQFTTALSARAGGLGFVNVFGEVALSASGWHAWTVAFAGAAGGDLPYGFAGMVERKEGSLNISK